MFCFQLLGHGVLQVVEIYIIGEIHSCSVATHVAYFQALLTKLANGYKIIIKLPIHLFPWLCIRVCFYHDLVVLWLYT